jgi:hypothetical protein
VAALCAVGLLSLAVLVAAQYLLLRITDGKENHMEPQRRTTGAHRFWNAVLLTITAIGAEVAAGPLLG